MYFLLQINDNIGPLFGTKSRSSLSFSNHLKDLCADCSGSFDFQLDYIMVTLFFRFFFKSLRAASRNLFTQINVQRNITWEDRIIVGTKTITGFSVLVGDTCAVIRIWKIFNQKGLVPRDHFSVIHTSGC